MLWLALTGLVVSLAGSDLCTPSMQVALPSVCPTQGPGNYSAQLAALPTPREWSELPTLELRRADPLRDMTYAKVTTPSAPLFATPEDAVANIVAQSAGQGFIYVRLMEAAQAGDQALYRTRGGTYIRAADVSVIAPTSFAGLAFDSTPERVFGWMVATVKPSPLPGVVPANDTKKLWRYRPIQVFAEMQVGPRKWYLVGPEQWVEERSVGLVRVQPRPAGVSGRWVQVDLYEQTMAAFEDDQLVYATLVSSGLDKWATQPGLFQIYAHLKTDRMRGAYEPDLSDYYALEDVPYVMYFDGDRALHGEYWHDRLGFKRSHGCVNLAPHDARWLYDWASKGTAVWVFDPQQQKAAETQAIGP